MADLADDQARFIAVLQNGPQAFPEGLFADEPSRVMLGLKAHANTISHARLVALEDTFPRTGAAMGHEPFNALSRLFIDQSDVRARKLMHIGYGFAAFIAGQGGSAAYCDIAEVEWQWLQSYHAADAPALHLADLAGLDEAGLLDFQLQAHPSARLVELQTTIGDALPDLAALAPAHARHLLITRPGSEVLLRPLTALQAHIAARVNNCASMRNLLSAAIETGDEGEALPAIFVLIEAGMLAKPEGAIKG